jgi:hypothetical protein
MNFQEREEEYLKQKKIKTEVYNLNLYSVASGRND